MGAWQASEGKAAEGKAAEGQDDSLDKQLFDGFAQEVQMGLSRCGRREGDGSRVILGATGGVRELFESGRIDRSSIDRFIAALRDKVGPNVEFSVLSGDMEAQCELLATRFIFGRLLSSHGQINLLSGGGVSCQFALGQPASPELYSVNLPLEEAQQRLQAAAHDRRARTAEEVYASYKKMLESQAWQMTPSLPSRFSGTFVGINLHWHVAKYIGCCDALLTVTQMIGLIDECIPGLLSRRGLGWERAVDCWAEKAETHWVIGASTSLRLKAILERFEPGSLIYFATTLPEGGDSDSGQWRDAHATAVSWPVGKMILLQEAEIGAKSRKGSRSRQATMA
uniref:Uncharacterized protein n=2 Tax=Haptolina brevifila TaxID=156173 RepID=A0A7S2J9L0_9EUKA